MTRIPSPQAENVREYRGGWSMQIIIKGAQN